MDADAENKISFYRNWWSIWVSMGSIITAVGCWMMPCRESWAGLTATLVLSILCPYHHHTGVETMSIFRQSWGLDIQHSAPKSGWFVPCLIPHTQGSEIDTDWLTSGIIWIISVLGPRLGNSVTLRLHNNDLATENISQPSYEIINIPGSRHSGTLELRLCFPSPSHLHSISRNQAVSGIYSMIQHEIGNYFTHHFDRVMIMMEHFPFLWPQ